MKIILKDFDSRKLFPSETSDEDINGMHICMSGAQYIVDIEKQTLTYIGGVSSMFVHSDFPVGDGLTPKDSTIEALHYISGFCAEYHDMCTPDFSETTLSYDFEKPNIEGLIKLMKHCRRIEANNWEFSPKFAMSELLSVAVQNYIG